jgi:membrane protein YdbS with pleckstrin-like domain
MAATIYAGAMPPDPDQRLAGRALAAWMLTGAGYGVVALIAVSAIVGAPLAILAAVVFAVLAAVVVPLLRYRTWRYAVRAEEIDLRRGAWVVRRTIVPMARVQHVDTSVTPLGRLFEISTLSIHTAAGKHEIPGLDAGTADRLRTEIARYAREPDDV